MNSMLLKTGILVVALIGLGLPAAAQVEIDSSTFGGLYARSIGPAIMSGRIAAIDAVAEDPLTIYAGAASGGVWKSKDGGLTWNPIFDDYIQSIGAIRIDPQDSNTVWVGTGESWVRNSVSVGAGVYKTTDGGDSWTFVGLKESERIARIVIDPDNTDTVFVCATGQLWSANEERGVYRTTDGGENWEQVLGVDENTGCSDIAIDPQSPNILYAGMWQFRRYPDFFESGGPGSALYKSTDGGKNWKELTTGLPEGEKGRIAVTVAPSRPSRVYAGRRGRRDGPLPIGRSGRKLGGDEQLSVGQESSFLLRLCGGRSGGFRTRLQARVLPGSLDGFRQVLHLDLERRVRHGGAQ